MRQDFIIEFDYFKNRRENFRVLNKIDNDFGNKVLTGYNVFINNIPTSLEFYVYLCFKHNTPNEIQKMKNLLFEKGIYRPDLSLELLLNRMAERGFNSYSINPIITDIILETAFFYKHAREVPNKQYFTESYIERLKKEGYNAFQKLSGGTTLFISHSSKQKKEMEEIMPYLNADNQLIWLDKFRIMKTDDENLIKREIAKGLNEAKKVLFYITQEFLKSRWCYYELDLSVKLHEEKDGYELLFLVDNAVKSKFINEYSTLIDSIYNNNIRYIDRNIKLEYQIENFIKKI